MPIVAGIVAALVIFLHCVTTVFAAARINIISSPSNLTAGEPFTLTASASGFAASSSYSFKVRIGSGSATMSKGQTKVTNSGTDSWFSDTDAWTNFPTFITDAFGIWSGDIAARPSGEAFPGINYIILRLKRNDQSSYCCDSASVSATVTVPVVQTTATENSEETKPTPSFDWSLPEKAILGESFRIALNLKNFIANTEYFLKARGGPDESHITKMQTKNGDSFFSDNEGWENFPVIKTDSNGNWSGDIFGLFGEDKNEGFYKVKVRARKKETDTFSESDFKTISLTKPPLVQTVASVAAKVATPAAKIEEDKPAPLQIVLGTHSAAIQTSVAKKTVEPPKNYFTVLLLGSGLILSTASVALFLYKTKKAL